ncbi:helix-turn-helix transcriptional regulator [Nonomuraea jabiensis]|uniref:DNA-binding CsgD family transcriptional regulator n=1 Tax=Nonomuraea jabiensis TaxID=882448 RepID=A0A7W9LEV6_9ACTN|nr:LuxR family transcriptional regulator [Nonomuraea jabiensis]MBB5781225.1 DNA-binding CsgD family transcriptional regulator [Nonomuraea jabiensis]
MLFGRSAEIATIDDVISRAREGAGDALVLRGEAGVGKTALLDLAASRGGSMRVLRTTGVEPESDLAFAALHQLLRPVAGLLDTLPGPQREAVRGALGLGGGASGDRFLLAAGVLSLLAEAAAPDGLVCVVDDFQWVDRASADALLFAARRLATERIAMLLAVRGDAPVKGVPPLRLGGLPEPAAAELLDASMPPAVKRELVAATGGNPLALREIVRRLRPGQLAGREPLPDPLPGGTQLFGEQVAALSDDARLVALLAAVESDLDLVLRASGAVEAGRGALHELEVAGLVRVEGASVRFRHPLIRSAVHEAAAPASRRAAHEALAGLSEGDRRAWHLAAAALGQDESVAAALADTADRARDRGGYGDAATALARAAELTPAPHTRAVRLKDAAMAAWLGGRPGQAESLLAEARDHAGGDRALEMEIAQLRGRFELNSGSAAEAVRILATGDSLDMLADAAEAASYVGDTAAIAEIGRRAAAFPEGFLRDVLAGIGLMLSDGTGHELLRRALDRTGELTEAAGFLWATAAASYLGEADLAADLAARAGRVARVSGMVGQLPVVLEFVATGERIAGRLAESQALSEEGLELAREAGYANTVAAHLANLAVLAALRGEEETCRGHAQEALAIAIPHRVGLRAGVAAYALAMLDLGAGRFAAAHDRFTAIAAAGPGAGHPTVVWRSTPDRIEAAVGAGDLEAARAALEAYERWSAQAATAESRALLTRCRALVGAGPEKELPGQELEEALRLHANPYEAARTALLLGERLRRAHRPGEARPHLRAALETFRRAGAEPWARRAHGELRAAGESAEPARGPALDALTPQELRIAGLVADGLSSKEIAAQLFLSPRTVEYHLYKIYPKLGIGTRTELARLVVLQKAPVSGDGML